MDSNDVNGSLGINRRDFMKVAGIGAAAMVMPGLMKNASAASLSGVQEVVVTTDVLIIGGGVAATFAAIKAKQAGADVTIVDKGTIGRSGLSPFFGAYGYYKEGGSVSRDLYVKSVSKTGQYINRPDYLEMYMDDSEDIANEFLSWGAGDQRVGGHASTYREQIVKNDIRLIERTMVVELLKKNDKIAGAVGLSLDEDRAVIIKAKAVVLCSGSGALKTSGFPCSSITHDGDAMAFRIGAELTGKEFCDFHWTHWENPADVWSNWQHNDELFHAISPQAISGAVSSVPAAYELPLQSHKGDVPVLMGTGSGESGGGAGPDARAARVPPGCRSLDLPVVWGATAGMSAHKCEGIFPDGDKCSSSVPGLFAAGDALFTGGASYSGGPGSSSSGSAVQGGRAGRYAAEFAKDNQQQKISSSELATAKKRVFQPRTAEQGYSPIWVTQVLQGIMVPYYVLNIKKAKRLEAALSNIEFLREHFAPNLLASDPHQLRQAHETQNMLLNSEMKLRAGLMRTESRGDHYREDYPKMDDKNWLAWIIITQDGDNMKLTKRDIPDEWKP
jgi:succinate dehydrogenase/fumarate reductase flavoprotein subunit